MAELRERFLSRLHTEYLKAKGYKKRRNTFIRDRDTFTERLQFQGSAWNSTGSPWRFYVNFGIEFHGIPPRIPDRDLPGTHCWTRIDTLVPAAPKDFELSGDDDNLARVLAEVVDQASRRVTDQIQGLRGRYEMARSPRLSLV